MFIFDKASYVLYVGDIGTKLSGLYLIKLVNCNCILELRCGKVDILQYNNRGLGVKRHKFKVQQQIVHFRDKLWLIINWIYF
jgi:hypothetical protein